LQQKEKAALDPIIKKAQEAIKAVAKEKSIVYVLDAKALIVLEGEDLLPAVKTSLGIQ
jgi:outer membrane protein